MERLKYIVEDSTIAELLGVQNFTNKESAILELVKNAYDAQANLPTGTRIEISALRDRWTEKSIRNLIDYLSITCNDNRMNIKVFPDYGKKVSYIFKRPQLGENFVTLIALFYNASEMKLHYTIESDEFSNIAKNYCPSTDLQHFSSAISILDELAGNTEIDSSDGELYSMLKELGNFSAELYFSLKTPTKQDVERFCYNYSALSDRYDEGVVLYRNAFSIASFDGEKDWLGLNQRSRKSPAAATHPTGAWRVRANQLSGKVEIDKKENYQLRDLANRQGLEENEYFKLFVKIITIGIAAFERYRQAIIRSIDKKNAPKPSPTTPMIDQILRGRNKEIHLTSNETKALAQEISVVKAESKSFQDEKESTEKKYRYDVRILNVLATTGLKASSIAHELKNDRNSVSVNYQYIVEALKEYGFWEDLCSQEYTEYSYKNVPQLLSRNKAINQKIVAFMDTMLDEIEKKKFSPRSLSVNSIMENIKANWMRDYASLLINLNVDESVYFETSEDIFTAIFDNLILNSWQQNKASSQIVINISIHKVGSLLKIVYEDSGVGLPPKYINDPMRILEVHESSRENGHGLGMWIVHNTIRMTGGDVISIDGHNGFHFNFELGEKL